MDVKQVEDSENICGVLIVFVKAIPYTQAIASARSASSPRPQDLSVRQTAVQRVARGAWS